MTETTGIRTDVTNHKYHPAPRSSSGQHPSKSQALPYTRRILDRWTDRITSSGLPGAEIVTDYLHEKYIKNHLIPYYRSQRRHDFGLSPLPRYSRQFIINIDAP
jgi:hypothetical protein